MKSLIVFKRNLQKILAVFGMVSLAGCATMGNVLNPFYEAPSEVAKLGDKNDHALNEGGQKEKNAVQALDAMATYQRANPPRPVDPVLQPAVVRLMWVPDHLNKNGDMVPAHYYYLKVLAERWALKDAFELENQLNGPAGNSSGGGSNVPFVVNESGSR